MSFEDIAKNTVEGAKGDQAKGDAKQAGEKAQDAIDD